MKHTNHNHLKVKKINPSAINKTRVYHWINRVHWINQGLLKELKLKTQLNKLKNQGIFHNLFSLIKYQHITTKRNKF